MAQDRGPRHLLAQSFEFVRREDGYADRQAVEELQPVRGEREPGDVVLGVAAGQLLEDRFDLGAHPELDVGAPAPEFADEDPALAFVDQGAVGREIDPAPVRFILDDHEDVDV